MLTLTCPVIDPGTDEALWDEDGLTDRGEQVYTEGDCWGLAWAVAELIRSSLGGGRLVTLGGQWNWWHVAVQVSPTHYLDATGLHTRSELEGAWGKLSVRVPEEFEASFEAYRAYLDIDWEFSAGPREAAQVAELLLDKYCYELGL